MSTTTDSKDLAREFGRAERRFRLLSVALIVLLAVTLIFVTRRPAPEPTVTTFDAGLVFLACEQPLLPLSQPSVSLWQVDPTAGNTVAQVAVELPSDSRFAYPCDAVPGLARRLFDGDYANMVVEVRTPSTGAEHVHLVTLASGRDRQLTVAPDDAFAPHPHHEIPVFGPVRQRVWYRAGGTGTVETIDPDSREVRQVTTVDPAAASFVVADEASGLILAQGATTGEAFVGTLALPNPRGDLAVSDETLHVLDEDVRVACATRPAPGDVLARLLSNASGTLSIADCLPADLRRRGALRPAVWLDDRTLIMFFGTASGPNTLLRLEIDDAGRLRVCPAVPASDWRHRAVVVAPDGASFVTDTERDGTRMLFAQPTDVGGGNQPAALPQPDVPAGAHLIGWEPRPAEPQMVAHVCGDAGTG